MAKAFKCDRCGKLYEKNENENYLTGLVTKHSGVIIDKYYDLCDECLSKFVEYIMHPEKDTTTLLPDPFTGKTLTPRFEIDTDEESIKYLIVKIDALSAGYVALSTPVAWDSTAMETLLECKTALESLLREVEK